MKNQALIIVDVLNEFIGGRLGSDKARAIIPNIAELANKADECNIPVIFVCDAHNSTDPEMKLWGEHAIKGTIEADVSHALLDFLDDRVFENSFIWTKKEYNAFSRLGLVSMLVSRDVEEVIIVGVATHICVAQSAIGAFQQGFDVIIVEDAVAGFPDTDEQFWLNHLITVADAKIVKTKEISIHPN